MKSLIQPSNIGKGVIYTESISLRVVLTSYYLYTSIDLIIVKFEVLLGPNFQVTQSP